MFLTAFKYILLLLSSAISFLSSWVFKFTIDNPNNPSRLAITKPGKVAFATSIICFLGAISVAFFDAKEQATKEKELTTLMKNVVIALNPENQDDEKINEVINDPIISKLAQTDTLFSNTVNRIEKRLGGKTLMINRLRALYPFDKFEVDSIVTVTSFNLRLGFKGWRGEEKVKSLVIQAINGIDSDIIGLQELTNSGDLQILMDSLPNHYVVHANPKTTERMFPVFLIKKSPRVKLLGTATSIEGNFSKKPILQKISIDQDTFLLANIHFKSMFGGQDVTAEKRKLEADVLSNWVEENSQSNKIILMGNFNGNITIDPSSSIKEVNNLYITSNELPRGSRTYISEKWGDLLFNHIMVSKNLMDAYISNSVLIYDWKKILPEIEEKVIRENLSDNYPISVAVRLGKKRKRW